MSTNGLLSSSPEILIHILGSCDNFAQAVAFASTCRDVHAVWKLNASSILDRVARQCIPAFDEALVAARATEIVKAAILNGKLPPKDIHIAELSAAVCKPQLPEMAGIFELQWLVEETEHFYLCGGALGWEIRPEPGPPLDLPDSNEWERSCRACFHRAVYRVLLSGSVLAGWHIEPFSSEGVPNRLPSDFPANLRVFCANYPGTEDDPWEGALEDEDIAFLERFIPFDQEGNVRLGEKQDELFGPLGRWLLQSMKKDIAHADLEWAQYNVHHKLNMSGFRDGSINEGKVILREVMRMLVAYENLTRALMNFDEKPGHGRNWNEEPWDEPVVLGGHKVFAIILGVYQMEQIQIADGSLRLVTQVGRLPDGSLLGPVQEKAIDIFELQEYLYRMSGRANLIDDCEASPPRVQLFTFMLHRFFNLQFQQGYLWTHDKYYDYLEFLADGAIFTNKLNVIADGTRILANLSGPRVYSFRARYS